MNFIFKHRDALLPNGEYLSNYTSMYNIYGFNHNYFRKCENIVNNKSIEKFQNIPIYYHIHNEYYSIITRDILLLASFFEKRNDLYEELVCCLTE